MTRLAGCTLINPLDSAPAICLPSVQQNAPVSPLFATLTDSAHLHHSTQLSRPLFSYSCALFCTDKKVNSLVFRHYRTLWQKHGGWGWGHTRILNQYLKYRPIPSRGSLPLPGPWVLGASAFRSSFSSVNSVFSVSSVLSPSFSFDFQLSTVNLLPGGFPPHHPIKSPRRITKRACARRNEAMA
jgi:hypothetical protein